MLVVRESDCLSGQCWWSGARIAFELDGADWTGPKARALVHRRQAEAFVRRQH